MKTEQAKQHALRLLGTGNMGTWSFETLVTWLECDCRCVYCDRDMLQDRDISYFFSHSDHLLPQSKYPQLADAPSNRVLSCKACNTIKRDWDPNSGGQIMSDSSQRGLSFDERSNFIAKTRELLKPLKETNEKQFENEKQSIKVCLSGNTAAPPQAAARPQ